MEEFSSAQTFISSNINDFLNVDVIFLPGVGNFTIAAEKLTKIKNFLYQSIEEGKIIFGICLGMELLGNTSEEGSGSGLNLISGNILSLPTSVIVPHIGWNQIVNVKDSYLLDGINPDSYVYFVHSFYFEVEKTQNIVAKTNYGIWFPSIVESNNVYGTQFHPEKSGKTGLKILENFLKIVKR